MTKWMLWSQTLYCTTSHECLTEAVKQTEQMLLDSSQAVDLPAALIVHCSVNNSTSCVFVALIGSLLTD